MSQVNAGLYGVERQALEVLRVEMEKYRQEQQLTPSLVQLLRATHEMLMRGAKSRAGVDTANKSPREILVELDQLREEFRQLVEQENEMDLQETMQ